MITVSFIEMTEIDVTTIHDYSYRKLSLCYEIDALGFQLSATIDTEPKCYARDEYDEGDFATEFMNDVPNIKISSIDCFDDQKTFTIDVHCEIMRLLLTDYHVRKSDYLSK
jgi:hypothetical protein